MLAGTASKDVIVLHDYFEAPEGGGRLALIAARGLGADMAYGYKTPQHPFFQEPFAGREYDLQVSVRLPLVKQWLLVMTFSSKTTFVEKYDAALYSGFYAPLAIRHRLDKHNVCYCHTPPRFIYDMQDFYMSMIPSWQRPLLHSFIKWLRPRYETSMKDMDVILANSENIKQRIASYLGLKATVIHPPCDVEKYDCSESLPSQHPYWLSAARHDPLKRVDLIVRAFVRTPDKRLVVISSGPETAKLRKLAAECDNIDIIGMVSEERYRELLCGCVASVYIPCEEDFGMTAVESLAAGKPVIASAEGGLLEILEDGRTGIFVTGDGDALVDNLKQALDRLDAKQAAAMRHECKKRAADFSTDRFLHAMRTVVEF